MQQSHFEITLEDLQSKMDAVLEIVASQPTRDEFDRLEDKVDGIADDVSAIKIGMKLHSTKLTEHDRTLKKHSLNLKRLNQKVT